MKNTTKVFLIILAAVMITSGIVIGALNDIYVFQNEIDITSAKITMYLDEVEWANNTLIDWGTAAADEYLWFNNFTVANTGSENLTVHLITQNLPSGWSMMWQSNNTYLPVGSMTYAALQLQVSAAATEGTYNWNLIVTTT